MELFTSDEKRDLEKLLSRTVDRSAAFNLEEIHGFLFGLTITPALIRPSEWLPVVFGEAMFDVDVGGEGEGLLRGLFTIYNRLMDEHNREKLAFPFDFDTLEEGDLSRAADWSYGLYSALSLREEVWGAVAGKVLKTPLTPDDLGDASTCFGVILAVADPARIPDLIGRPGFDPATDEQDAEALTRIFFLLPSAVRSLLEISAKREKG